MLLVHWLPFCHTCIKWGFPTSFDWMSGLDKAVFLLLFVSPYDTMKLCIKCHLGDILVYAGDIFLIVRSVTGFQKMIAVIETYCD
jgi:hypothetical protein